MIEQFSPKVRVRHVSVEFGQDDILIERLVNDEWVKHRSYNSLSDSYAHTNARRSAFKLSLSL